MKSKFLFILPADSSDRGIWQQESWRISRHPPLGLLSIMSYLDSKGYPASLIDCRELIIRYRTDDVYPIIRDKVTQYKPDLIGINLLTTYFEEVKCLSRYLKEVFPDIPLFAGGCHPSVLPQKTLEQNSYLDGVCVGAGEEVCLDLVEGKSWDAIEGLMLREVPEKFVPRDVEWNLDKYPFLNYNIINHKFYSAYNAFTTFGIYTSSLGAITSRGCPYSCRFCASKWSRPLRQHSAEYVTELAKYLSSFRIDTINFYDDTFALSKNRLTDILDGFRSSGLFFPQGKIGWKAQLRTDQITPELLEEMKSAGCIQIGVGFESGSDRMLKVINKKTTVEMNRQAFRYIKEAGLDLSTSFMIGLPGETEDEMIMTINFMKELLSYGNVVVGCASFRPLPGSPYYYEFIEKGIVNEDEVDWVNLGNFVKLPDICFADAPLERVRELFTKAKRIKSCNAGGRIRIHKGIVDADPALASEISRMYDTWIISPAQTGNGYQYLRTDSAVFPRLVWMQFKRLFRSVLHRVLPGQLRRTLNVIRRSGGVSIKAPARIVRTFVMRNFPEIAIKYKRVFVDKSIFLKDPVTMAKMICATQEFLMLKSIVEFHPKAGMIEGDRQFLWNGGITVFPHGDDVVHQIWTLTLGAPEPDEILLFLKVVERLPEDAVMMELGAGNGFYSIIMGKESPKAKLILVEANPRIYSIAKENMALNDFLDRSVVINAAVAGTSGKTFGVREAYYGSSIRAEGGDYQVSSVSVDDLMKNLNLDRVHIVHVDVQRAEEMVIQGMHEALSQQTVDYVFVGTHSQDLHKNCEKKLNSYGYKTIFSRDKNQCIGFDGILVCANPALFEGEHPGNQTLLDMGNWRPQ